MLYMMISTQLQEFVKLERTAVEYKYFNGFPDIVTSSQNFFLPLR